MKKSVIFLVTCFIVSFLTGCDTQFVDTSAETQIEVNEPSGLSSESEIVPEENIVEENGFEETEQPVEEVEQEVELKVAEESEVVEQPEEQKKPIQEESLPLYTYVDLNQTMYAKQAVNVRDLPSTEGNKIGGLSKSQEVTVTGQCNETNWYRIIYIGSIGYVSNNYLIDEMPVIEAAELEQTTSDSNSSNNSVAENNGSTADNGQSGGNSVTVPTQEETGENLVWVPTNGGKKYHKKSSCSNMKDPMQVSLETATANGYTACKRCYK